MEPFISSAPAEITTFSGLIASIGIISIIFAILIFIVSFGILFLLFYRLLYGFKVIVVNNDEDEYEYVDEEEDSGDDDDKFIAY